MEDKDLCDMIHMKWLEKSKIDFSSHTQVLLYKFKNLKFDVIDWEKWKKERNQEALILIETELNDMSDMVDDKNKLFDNNKGSSLCWLLKEGFLNNMKNQWGWRDVLFGFKAKTKTLFFSRIMLIRDG